MKTHVKRAKTYILMAETVLSELRNELERAEEDPKLSEDSFLEIIVEARDLLRFALDEHHNAGHIAKLTNFAMPASRLVSRIDSLIGEKIVFAKE